MCLPMTRDQSGNPRRARFSKRGVSILKTLFKYEIENDIVADEKDFQNRIGLRFVKEVANERNCRVKHALFVCREAVRSFTRTHVRTQSNS